MRTVVHYIPLFTTILAAVFGTAVMQHWRRKKSATYLLWWGIGIYVYGIGTLAEGLTTLFGWQEWLMKLWYVSGALLGGVVLAQGTVYLMLKRRTANILTVVVFAYVLIAAFFVLITPVNYDLVETYRLTGTVMEWRWVRLLTPALNIYALVFLTGGALWSAWKYWKLSHELGSRVLGNIFIAIGALLPGIGGSFAKAGQVEVLYALEFVGLLSIWFVWARWLLILEIISYGVLMVLAGLQSAKKHASCDLMAGVPLAIMTMHLSWGTAFLWSFVKTIFFRTENSH